GRPLPQPALRPAVHPRARGQPRRRAAVGAGREPHVSGGHPPRPPIPIRPFDPDAAAPGAGELAAWLAGCLGREPRVVERVVAAERPSADDEPMPVGEVAAAVDAGREAAAKAAGDGVTVLVG